MASVQPADISTQAIIGGRARLCINNHSLSDLHVHWTGDVHEDDQWDFIPNGNSAERKSCKVEGLADFRLEVHRNDNGNPGPRLGDPFHVKIIRDAYDAIELIRVGDQLWFIRASTVVRELIGVLTS